MIYASGVRGTPAKPYQTFELGVIRSRMHDAKHGNALQGNLRISVPIGYIWHREIGLGRSELAGAYAYGKSEKRTAPACARFASAGNIEA